jgi:hypothetical protein
MKIITIFLFLSAFSTIGRSQNDTTLITKRDPNSILQGSISLDSYTELFVGQKYTFEILVSAEHDILVRCQNAEIEIIENSRISTGALRYTVVPLDTGECRIRVGVRIDEKSSKTLLLKYYPVVNYPSPPIYISGIMSGEVIQNLDDSSLLKCHYPTGSGVFDSYKIKSWTAQVGDRTFEGTDAELSKELINVINNAEDRSILHITIKLDKNKTGYTNTEGVFIIR